MGSHFLLQGNLPDPGSNLCLLHLLHWQVGSLPDTSNNCFYLLSNSSYQSLCSNKWYDLIFLTGFWLIQQSIILKKISFIFEWEWSVMSLSSGWRSTVLRLVALLEARPSFASCGTLWVSSESEEPTHRAVPLHLARNHHWNMLLPACSPCCTRCVLAEIDLFLSPFLQPWCQKPFPDRFGTAQPCCPETSLRRNTPVPLLVFGIQGCWAGLASGITLISTAAFSWPAFWVWTSLPVWSLCFLLGRISYLSSYCHAFWFPSTVCVYSFEMIHFSHFKGFWLGAEIFLVHYFNPVFYVLLYDSFS